MKSFIESEKKCKAAFKNGGPFWFASSPGKETSILFVSNEDFAFVMNVISQMAFQFPNMKITAFEVMDNHFHFVVQCENQEMIRHFFACIKKRLHRISPHIKKLELDIRPIDDLNSVRNHIAYTHRNGYVANPDCTPFSYRWGTGRYYFNDIPVSGSLGDMNVSHKRILFKGRDPQLPDEWGLVEKYIDPRAYCDVRFGMSLFRDAHQYFSLLTKNVEAYSDLANELGDGEFLTDQELFSQLQQMVHDQYHVSSLKDLSKAQYFDIARSMHYDYHSSNGQIRRVLGLSQYEVDSLFPLGKQHSVK